VHPFAQLYLVFYIPKDTLATIFKSLSKADTFVQNNMVVLPLAPTDPSKLAGLSILITGGASGLGRSSATLFAKSGAFVTIADVQDSSEIAAELSGQGYNVKFVHCDVTDWDSQIRAFQAALQFSHTKTLDMVAAFAGADVTGHLVDHVFPTEVTVDEPPPPIPILYRSRLTSRARFTQQPLLFIISDWDLEALPAILTRHLNLLSSSLHSLAI
jgi:NADPH:quinone reductase-like Zn-dependent oxidoreductase